MVSKKIVPLRDAWNKVNDDAVDDYGPEQQQHDQHDSRSSLWPKVEEEQEEEEENKHKMVNLKYAELKILVRPFRP